MPVSTLYDSRVYENEAQKVSIGSVSELTEHVNGLLNGFRFDSIYLRGHRNETWHLLPTIGRCYCCDGRKITKFEPDQEKYLLHRFRRSAYSFVGRVPDEWETLYLARHHALPVRILDWTTNPLVALYFACTGEGKPSANGAVWVFLRRQHDHDVFLDPFDEQYLRKHPWEIRGAKIVYAPYVSRRMTAQSCVFTIQENPWKPLADYEPGCFAGNNFRDLDIEKIEKWCVPKDKKPSLLYDLERWE